MSSASCFSLRPACLILRLSLAILFRPLRFQLFHQAFQGVSRRRHQDTHSPRRDAIDLPDLVSRQVQVIMKVEDVRMPRLQVFERFGDQLNLLLLFHLGGGVKALSGLWYLLEGSHFPPDVVDDLMGGDGIDECFERALSPECAFANSFDDAYENLTPDVLPIRCGTPDGVFHPVADLRPVFEEDFFGAGPFSCRRKGFPFSRGSEDSGIPQIQTSSRAPLSLNENFEPGNRLLEGSAG